MAADATGIHQLIVGLIVVVGILLLELAAIASFKLERECREAVEARVHEHVLDGLIEGLDGDAPIVLPPPKGWSGGATRETLIAMIGTVRGEARERLVRSLEDGGYVEEAARSLTSRSAITRARGCMILGGMRSETANGVLHERLRADSNQNVRLTAAEALAEIGSPLSAEVLIDAVKRSSQWQRLRAANTVAQMGEAAVPALLASLTDTDEANLCLILDILCDIGHVADFEPVMRLLSHSSGEVRGRAVELLGIAGDGDALDDILELTKDELWFVRVRSVKSMARLGPPVSDTSRERYFATLSGLLSDTAWWVRQHAAQALANAGTDGYEILRTSVSDVAAAALQVQELRESTA